MIRVLNAYFERLVRRGARQGGEVLKFIGDGMLAIFPVTDATPPPAAAAAALKAARAGLAAINALNGEAGDALDIKANGARSTWRSRFIAARSSTAISAPPTGSTSPSRARR